MTVKEKTLVAVCASDLHLSNRAPLFRSPEEDWISTQRGYLRQLKKICTPRNNRLVEDGLPLFVGGDLFDSWKVSHEVVNLAIGHLPERVFSIAGNHDLLHHRLEDLLKTAYGVLVESSRIIDVKPHDPVVIEGPVPIRLHGFPYGIGISSLKSPNDFYLEIALVHSYLWTNNTGYEGAPEDKKLTAYQENMQGYDVVIFGDNHKTIEWNLDRNSPGPSVFNPGGFSIRKRDETHNPCVGKIYSDGTIIKKELDTSNDKYLGISDVDKITSEIGVNSFIEELLELAENALDFGSFLRRLLDRNKTGSKVKDLILKILKRGDLS